MNITELLNSIRVTDAGFTEIKVLRSALEIGDNDVRAQGQSFSLLQEARNRLYAGIGAPATYLNRLSLHTQAAILNEAWHWGNSDDPLSVVFHNNRVFSLSRGDLIRLPLHHVVVAVIEALGENAHTLSPTRIVTDGDRLELDLASPRKSIHVRRGDVVQGGLHILHTRFGDEATVIEKFVYRLRCKNGMTYRECASQNGIARTRKLAANHPNGEELQKEQIRRLTMQAWDSLEPQLDQLRVTADRSANVESLLGRWLLQARISSRSMLPRLLEAWHEEGAEHTQYGAINALTRVATHDTGLRTGQRRVLASLAGILAFSNAHLCPQCFSRLTDSVGAQASE